MKTSLAPIAISLLLAAGAPLLPTAEADTCAVFDPTLEDVVCGAYHYAWCIVGGGPKEIPSRLARCDVVLA